MKIIRNRILLKSAAIFFVLEISVSTILPATSWALTAGPTAPEFSSFEPVDTTDMVNLATGDFIYNTPILEVPGPEGGYPLSLSYHAGIKVDQEASWVGLGFTLNAGAISRSVNGFADDNVESEKVVRDYWGGGSSTTKTFSVGISVFGAGTTLTKVKTTDTYKGFSTSSQVNYSFNPIETWSSLNAFKAFPGAGKGTQSYLSNMANNLGKFSGTDLSHGASISSKGVKTNFNASVAGNSLSMANNSAGRISSFRKESGGDGVSIGFFNVFNLQLANKEFYVRYWSDEAQSLLTYGALYPLEGNAKIDKDFFVANSPNQEFVSYAFDTYQMMDVEQSDPAADNVIDDVNDPGKQLGGSLPAYDHFSVTGQGTGGYIQPYIFQNCDLNGQNLYERDRVSGKPILAAPNLEYISMRKSSNKKVDFRFLNDFSNALTITPSAYKANSDDLDLHTVSASAEGYNNTGINQKLAGSKHIEWFSNEEIANGSASQLGFIDFYANRTDRKLQVDIYEDYLQPEAGLPLSGITYGTGEGTFTEDTYAASNPYDVTNRTLSKSLRPKQVDLKKKIGGFMITNETGVTYHYALPVYNYNEYTRVKTKNPAKETPTFREFKNDDPYAYTWLLTAITGPDYVDRNENGSLDDEDWGYWVKFDYGRWADSYQWRTPHTGYTNDVESESLTFSYGIKELYYLDAIETKSHKAIFIKSKRKDGRGVTSRLEGGSNPRLYTMSFKAGGSGSQVDELTYKVSPVATMKLDAIYLFQKEKLEEIALSKDNGEKYLEATWENPIAYPYTGDLYSFSGFGQTVEIKQGVDFVHVKYHNGDLVYDDDDIHDLPLFKSSALRTIEFNTDYSLASGVPNSIGYLSDITSLYCIPMNFQPDDLDGRISDDYEWPITFGANCAQYVGPICNVDNQLFYSGQSILARYTAGANGQCPNASTNYRGNSITYYRTGKLTLKSIKFLGRERSDLMPATTFSYLKNPDYSPQKYDEWGYYKSDFDPYVAGHTRRITSASAINTDAWSLSSIVSPLGSSIEIGYESNQYYQSVYNNFSIFGIEKVEPGAGTNEVKVTFKEKGLELSRLFTAGNSIDLKSFLIYQNLLLGQNYKGFKSLEYSSSSNDVVKRIEADALVITSQSLRAEIDRTTYPFEIGTNQCEVHFVAGFIKAMDQEPQANGVNPKFLGGVRVRQLAVNGMLSTSKSVFDYTDPISGKSSGVTSFVPFNLPGVIFPTNVVFFDKVFQEGELRERKRLLEFQSSFQSKVNSPLLKVMTFASEAPGPGVIYGYVSQHNFYNDKESDTYSQHHFQVFNENMIIREKQDFSTSAVQRSMVTLKNNAVDVGNILFVKVLSSQDIPLTTTNYGYLYDNVDEPYEQTTLDSKQGIVEQSFHKFFRLREYKVTYDYANWWEYNIQREAWVDRNINTIYDKKKALITKRQDRSNKLTSVVEIDHKLGLTTESQNHAFDFYSGQTLKTLTTDGYGNNFMTIAEPAYQQYPEMGLKVFNLQNKHMLTQEGSSYTYKVAKADPNQHIGLVGASVQTWSDDINALNPLTFYQYGKQPGIWRKSTGYSYIGDDNVALENDGLYPSTNVVPFAAWDKLDPVPTGWQDNGSVTLYDAGSRALEAIDQNGLYAATRMTTDQTKVAATIVNGRYGEFGYTGAEDFNSNGISGGIISLNGGIVSPDFAHTGKSSIKLNAGISGLHSVVVVQDKKYKRKMHVSFWLKNQPNLDVVLYYKFAPGFGGTSEFQDISLDLSKFKQANGWYLCEVDVPISLATISTHNFFVTEIANVGVGTGPIYVDDFRVHPHDAVMTSYVYYEWDQLSHILDNNNLYTEFTYDDLGRLEEVYKETFDEGRTRVSRTEYQFVKE